MLSSRKVAVAVASELSGSSFSMTARSAVSLAVFPEEESVRSSLSLLLEENSYTAFSSTAGGDGDAFSTGVVGVGAGVGARARADNTNVKIEDLGFLAETSVDR